MINETLNISSRSKVSLSSFKPGFGTHQLLHPSTDKFWQSDGPSPHYINFSFSKLTSIDNIQIYLDYKQDESYSPKIIQIKAGTSLNSLHDVCKRDLLDPTGWYDFILEDVEGFVFQVCVLANQQSGKDTHVRGIRLLSRMMSLQNDTLIDVPKAIAYKIVETSSYLGLSISGKCLNIALNTSDKITSTLEPYVMLVIAHLKKYFKNSSLATPKKIQFYQVRNQVLEIIQLGLFAIHKEPTNPTEYIENEQLLNSYHIYASGKQSEELNFTFVGSGWLLFYELGVAKCLLQNIQPDILEYCNFTGSGTGSIIAALLVLKLNLGEIERKLIEIVTGLSKKLLGPVGCLSTIWRGFLIEVIPDFDDLDHRLLISLTKFPTFENVVINDIKNKDELIDCLLASCYIPILFESPVRVKGQMFVGGDLSKGMSSGTEENLTISTSPQPGQANICPSTIKYTAIQEVFPTDKENVLTEMVLDGYTDARSWLLRMNRAHGLPDRLFRTDFLTKPNSIEQ